MAVFPNYARIVAAGYGEQANYGVLRTDMDGGIAKQRVRWSTPIVTRDVTVLVNDLVARLQFEEWLRSSLHGGVGWFSWTDLDRSVKQARFVGGSVKWSSPGGVWTGQAQLETVG